MCFYSCVSVVNCILICFCLRKLYSFWYNVIYFVYTFIFPYCFHNIKVHVNGEMLTRVVEQRLFLSFLGRRDQIPDEALDLVITFVVFQAVNQQSPAQQKVNTFCICTCLFFFFTLVYKMMATALILVLSCFHNFNCISYCNSSCKSSWTCFISVR